MGISVSVERLRVWLLVGAGLLVAVIAAFLGYAHYRAHRFLAELPSKLGADIRQETNAFTYSQSDGKKTIYTIHAAKAIQHKDGKYTLRDVGIVLYGRKQERADRIYGNEFEYDQNAGVIRAIGEVHLDLQAPAAKDAKGKMDYAAGHDAADRAGVSGADGRVIHVTTSGLVYLQKLGVAATDQEVEFEAGGMKGQAVGADYSSDTGVVVLHSAVKMVGLERGQPVVLTASRAELDRENQRVMLSQAKYVTVGGATGGGGETVEAQQAVVHLRSDGSAERMDAEGAVTLKDGDGGMITAPRGVMMLNAANQPQSAVLSGGVKYGAVAALRQAQGEAAEGKAAFDRVGRLQQVVLTGAVHLHERLRSADVAGGPWSERDLNAGVVELAVNSNRAGKAQLRDAKASENARLLVTNPVGKSLTSSALSGDVLTAHFTRVDGVDHLAEVHGEGHTLLRRVTATGAVNTSSGDSLEANFRPVPRGAGHIARGAAPVKQGADEIVAAVVQGHVVLTQQPVKKAGEVSPPAEERATAERAVFDGKLETTTLTGNVQVSDADSVLWADRVVANQETGDATADGSVKVSYLQPKSGAAKDGVSGAKAATAGDEPVHVLAARAELKHDSQVTTFYGVVGKPARLWQEASQVEAPVIEFEQKQKKLLARGDGQGVAMVVHTVLTSAAKPDGAKAGAGKTSVLRVSSRELAYSDESREAVFSGGVQVLSADGSMRGQQAVVYLLPAPVAGAKTGMTKGQSGFMGGSVDRMVASGHVVIDQPGRRATGEQVVYTASDGMFVLTGTTDVLPKVVDEQRGTVTGTSLRFHAGDESVVVSNGGDSGAGQRVRTETRVKKH
jgi:lipopolysaccharide export system protein LptA